MFEKQLYLKILRYLRPFGINHQTDIYTVFKKSHNKPESRAHEVFQSRPGQLNTFLEKMKDAGYIEYTPATPPGTIYETDWSTPFAVNASITALGYAYVTEQDSATHTKRIAILALIISLLSLGIDFYQTIADKPQTPIIAKELPQPKPLSKSNTTYEIAIDNQGHLLPPLPKKVNTPPSFSDTGRKTP